MILLAQTVEALGWLSIQRVARPAMRAGVRTAVEQEWEVPNSKTVEVPFVMVGNKQALTDQQLCKMPHLVDFVVRFQKCFERDDARCCYYFHREGSPG